MKQQKLADGIYEKIISKGFDRELQAAIQSEKVWAHIEEMDSQDAVPYLAHYIKKLVQCCLKDIADHEEDDALNGEMQLTNELINLLSKRHTELGTDHIVTRRKFLLMQLLNRQNQLRDHTIEHPMTSLSRSFLFTNSHKDISLVTELSREIASSDRIDFLVSFIRFSGLTLILPQLRKFPARGGQFASSRLLIWGQPIQKQFRGWPSCQIPVYGFPTMSRKLACTPRLISFIAKVDTPRPTLDHPTSLMPQLPMDWNGT